MSSLIRLDGGMLWSIGRTRARAGRELDFGTPQRLRSRDELDERALALAQHGLDAVQLRLGVVERAGHDRLRRRSRLCFLDVEYLLRDRAREREPGDESPLDQDLAQAAPTASLLPGEASGRWRRGPQASR